MNTFGLVNRGAGKECGTPIGYECIDWYWSGLMESLKSEDIVLFFD